MLSTGSISKRGQLAYQNYNKNSVLKKIPNFEVMIENEILNKKVDELSQKLEDGWACANYWRRKCLEIKMGLESDNSAEEMYFKNDTKVPKKNYYVPQSTGGTFRNQDGMREFSN
jgi:hypothetical protein